MALFEVGDVVKSLIVPTEIGEVVKIYESGMAMVRLRSSRDYIYADLKYWKVIQRKEKECTKRT